LGHPRIRQRKNRMAQVRELPNRDRKGVGAFW
jgi:hypothetical protein